MNPRPKRVIAATSYQIDIEFLNGEIRRFDAKPYLTYPAFQSLNDAGYSALSRVEHGTVTWPDGTDFCPDTIYVESALIGAA